MPAGFEVDPGAVGAPFPRPWVRKYSAQLGSTELGSAVYCSNISSNSQSFAPNSSVTFSEVVDESGTVTFAFFRCSACRAECGPPASVA